MDEAILHAKQRKKKRLDYELSQKRIEDNRKTLTSSVWSYEVTKAFMINRMPVVFTDPKKPFVLDQHNTLVFELLCHYFSDSPEFVALATNMKIDKPSLTKGIFLAGSFGTGKTWMMKLFQRNKKVCYIMANAKKIAAEFQTDGQEEIDQYVTKRKNALNDALYFYQPYSGLCIDDIGTEEIKNNYGNKANVIGDLLELRYAQGDVGPFLHGSTNLSASGLLEFYGGRVISRMKECFNIIELKGPDRRGLV